MRKHSPRSDLNNWSVAKICFYMQTYVFLPTSAGKLSQAKWDVCLAKDYSRHASARRGTVGLREAGEGHAKIVCSYEFLARVRVIKPQRWDIFLCLRLTRNTHTYTRARTDTNVSDILSHMFIVTQPGAWENPRRERERVDKNYCYDCAHIISWDLAENAGNAAARGWGDTRTEKVK